LVLLLLWRRRARAAGHPAGFAPPSIGSLGCINKVKLYRRFLRSVAILLAIEGGPMPEAMRFEGKVAVDRGALMRAAGR